MSEPIYWKIPSAIFRNGKRCCPVCFFEIDQYRTKKFNVFAHKHGERALFEYELPYCELCNTPVVHADLIRPMRKSNDGYRVDISLPAVIDEKPLVRLKEYDEETKVSMNRGAGYEMTEIISSNGTSQKIFFVQSQTYERLQLCMRCASPICVSILGRFKKSKETTVKWCSCCNSLFWVDSKENRRILQEYFSQFLRGRHKESLRKAANQICEKNEIVHGSHGKLDIDQQNEEQVPKKEKNVKQVANQEKIQNIPSAVILVVAISCQGNTKIFTIVEKTKYVYEKMDRYHYTSEQAREILAAAFIQHKNKTFILDGVTYRILEMVFPEEKQKVLPERLVPRKWYIKKDGGFYSSLHGTDNSIVDMLVYSPFTEKYQIVTATYSVDDDCCYTDIKIYRSFVKELGNPELKLSLIGLIMDGDGMFGGLNETSLLKEYGYDVSKKTNLSEKERQGLLAEIVDLDIMKVHEIVNYIDFFIESHPQKSHEIARSKWRADRKYITSYKANPERFLIAQNNNPKR